MGGLEVNDSNMVTSLDEMGRQRQMGALGISCADKASLFVGA